MLPGSLLTQPDNTCLPWGGYASGPRHRRLDAAATWLSLGRRTPVAFARLMPLLLIASNSSGLWVARTRITHTCSDLPSGGFACSGPPAACLETPPYGQPTFKTTTLTAIKTDSELPTAEGGTMARATLLPLLILASTLPCAFCAIATSSEGECEIAGNRGPRGLMGPSRRRYRLWQRRGGVT